MQTNDFREDLFYRLNVIHIDIPPLRERREDIPLLFEYFLTQYAASSQVARPSLSEEAHTVMKAFDWPGNVRQLRNVAERLVVRLKSAQDITPMDLPREILASWPASRRQPEERLSMSRADHMFERLVTGGESFWTVVHEPFMDRDITRDDVRALVSHGAELAKGDRAKLIELLNVGTADARRFTNFLRKYDCLAPSAGAGFTLQGSVRN